MSTELDRRQDAHMAKETKLGLMVGGPFLLVWAAWTFADATSVVIVSLLLAFAAFVRWAWLAGEAT